MSESIVDQSVRLAPSSEGTSEESRGTRICLSAVVKDMSKWRFDAQKLIFFLNCDRRTGGSAEISKATLLVPALGCEVHTKSGFVRRVAVKQFRFLEDGDRQKQGALFAYELSLLKNLNHDNVIKLLGFVEDLEQGIAWIVLSWASNGNVREFVRSRNWAIPERLSLIRNVAFGVEYLHSRKPPICHGDLKSLNIVVDAGYSAVITDFGSARKLEPHTVIETTDVLQASEPPSKKTLDQVEGSLRVQLEDSGSFITLTGCGYTYRWAAPELLVAERFSLATDMWAFGWICWEILTGEIPFSDLPSRDNVLARVVTGNLPSITTHAQITEVQAMCVLMARCWKMNPAQRPNALECRHEMDEMLWHIPSPQNASTAPEKYSAILQTTLAVIHLDHGRPCEALRCARSALDLARSRGNTPEITEASMLLGDLLVLRGSYAEAEELYSEVRGMCDRIRDEQGIAEVALCLGTAYFVREQYDKAESFYEEALEIWARVFDDRGVARVTQSLAELQFRRGEYYKAESLLHEVWRLSIRTRDKTSAAEALLGLGKLSSKCACRPCREHELLFNEAQAIYAQLGDHIGVATALLEQGHAHQEREEYIAAETLSQEAREIGIQTGDKPTVAEAAWALGEIYWIVEEYANAEQFYTEALDIFNCLGYQKRVAGVIFALGTVHYEQDNHSEAESFYRQAQEIWERVGNDNGAANAAWMLGKIHVRRDEFADAKLCFLKSLEIQTSGESLENVFGSSMTLGEVHRELLEYGEAELAYTHAWRAATQLGDQGGVAHAALKLGDILHLREAHMDAVPFYLEARDIFTRMEIQIHVAQAAEGLGHIHKKLNDFVAADAFYTEALAIWRRLGDRQDATQSLSSLAKSISALKLEKKP